MQVHWSVVIPLNHRAAQQCPSAAQHSHVALSHVSRMPTLHCPPFLAPQLPCPALAALGSWWEHSLQSRQAPQLMQESSPNHRNASGQRPKLFFNVLLNFPAFTSEWLSFGQLSFGCCFFSVWWIQSWGHWEGTSQSFSSPVISLALFRTCSQTQQLLPLESRCSLQGSHQSLLQWGRSVGSHVENLCTGTLTSRSSQLRDALGGFIIRVLSGHHLVPLAALFVQHMGDLQGSLSLCSQVQILLGKVGPQLPDFKLEERTTPQSHVMWARPEVSMLQLRMYYSFYHWTLESVKTNTVW